LSDAAAAAAKEEREGVAARERRGCGARRWGLAEEEAGELGAGDEGRRRREDGVTPAPAAAMAMGMGIPLRNPRERARYFSNRN
jgi:hypothetical protein